MIFNKKDILPDRVISLDQVRAGFVFDDARWRNVPKHVKQINILAASPPVSHYKVTS